MSVSNYLKSIYFGFAYGIGVRGLAVSLPRSAVGRSRRSVSWTIGCCQRDGSNQGEDGELEKNKLV